MLHKITIQDFFSEKYPLPLIDVRSPGEFAQGHIPQAVNIPLFSDEERAAVGTVYKKQSKEEAVSLGYQFVTPKLSHFINESRKIAPDGCVAVHCWRGGMRSQSFAEHLHDHGFQEVFVIEGGYKAFRNYVLAFFEQSFNLRILGGYTGSGKTIILHELKKRGEQVIDLEGLAHHKGSAFGALGELPQPSSEYFENLLFEQWRQLDLQQPVWIEDESARIGKVQLPNALYEQLRDNTLHFLDIPQEERIKHLVKEYAHFDKPMLAHSIELIYKRLGGQHVKKAMDFLKKENYTEVARIMLRYYDKAYLYGVEKREQSKVKIIPVEKVNSVKNAELLVKMMK